MPEKASPGQRLFRVLLFGLMGLVAGVSVAALLEGFGADFRNYYYVGVVVYIALLGAEVVGALRKDPYTGRTIFGHIGWNALTFGVALFGLLQGHFTFPIFTGVFLVLWVVHFCMQNSKHQESNV